MELNTDYKRTELGLIPKEWNIYAIGDSMRLINGRAFKQGEWKEVGLPIIRIQNLNDTETRFNYYAGQVDDRHRIQPGDILFAWSGTTGTSFGARIWGGPVGVLNQHIFKVLPDQNKLTSRYAYLILLRVQQSIEKQAHGFKASFVHVKKSDLLGIQLPVPPTKGEQEAIAEALGDADAFIESLEQLIAKKRYLKQSAMQELLTGRKRLPGYRGEWKQSALRTFVHNFIVPMRDKPKRLTGHIPWCRIEDFEGKYLSDSKSGQYVDDTTVRYMNLKIHPAGTLLVSCSADLGRCAIVGRPLVSNQTFIGLVLDAQRSSNEFFYYYMTSRAEDLNDLSSGTTISYLSRVRFEEFQVFVPLDTAEQTAIAAVLSDMDTEIAALEAKLSKARQIKQGMMQDLLTGKIRLV